MQDAGVRIGHMGGNHGDLQPAHEFFRRAASALHAEGDDAAGAGRHIFLRPLIVTVSGQPRIVDPGDLRMVFQELGYLLAVFAVALHSDRQRFQSQIEHVAVHRGGDRSQVAHQLRCRLGDVGAGLTEFFRIGDAVIGLVRRREAREFVLVGHPVKVAGVDDASAHRRVVAVHIFGRGVRHDVRAEFDRPAVDRRGKGIVDDQRHAVGMGRFREAFNVEHDQRRVGDRLPEDRLRVRFKGCFQLFIGAVRINEGKIDSHPPHRDVEQVEAAAVDRGGRDDMVPRPRQIKDRIKCRCLPGRSHDGGGPAFQRRDLGRDVIVRGVLQTGVKVPARLQIEQPAHLLAAVVLECRALNDRDHARIAVSGFIACLNAFRFLSHQ